MQIDAVREAIAAWAQKSGQRRIDIDARLKAAPGEEARPRTAGEEDRAGHRDPCTVRLRGRPGYDG
ncbi:hypothetical protein ABZZ17_35925 [Streptomyces sp. NPDC006512]|uniref:hypothetical protein n=1 Tax=Streptomyces sp. NPDC006512 TaxID=3154307 RepID=UPI0033B30B4F